MDEPVASAAARVTWMQAGEDLADVYKDYPPGQRDAAFTQDCVALAYVYTKLLQQPCIPCVDVQAGLDIVAALNTQVAQRDQEIARLQQELQAVKQPGRSRIYIVESLRKICGGTKCKPIRHVRIMHSEAGALAYAADVGKRTGASCTITTFIEEAKEEVKP